MHYQQLTSQKNFLSFDQSITHEINSSVFFNQWTNKIAIQYVVSVKEKALQHVVLREGVF